jgi:hypothetical protein
MERHIGENTLVFEPPDDACAVCALLAQGSMQSFEECDFQSLPGRR